MLRSPSRTSALRGSATLAMIAISALTFGACAQSPASSQAPAPMVGPAGSATPSVAGDVQSAAGDTSRALVGSGLSEDVVAGEVGADSVRRRKADSTVTKSEVTRRAVGVFGDSVVQQGAPAEAAKGSVASASASDMDVDSYLSQDRVEHFVGIFSGSAREHIQARLGVGTRYEPMIRRMMRDGGLPEDLYYLALIESGFDVNAYSRAAAVGMWQFMTSTAKGMGLRVDWWVDERRDPVKSTRAAVGFIRGMRDQFGSLYLAAAAYNGGPGRISRGLERYADELEGTPAEDAFFVLADKDYLKNETKDYVPQLIAAAIVARDPARYGLTIDSEPPFVYDSVRVEGSTPLAAIAKAADTSVAAIMELNPQILRGMTPPRTTWLVRVPPGHSAGFARALAALPKEERTAFHRVEVKKGQSLESIADRAGISEGALVRFNQHIERTRRGRLVPGQILLVPTRAVAAAARSVPDPSIERYGRTGRTVFHIVKRGETLGGIARHYHTTTAALMRTNHLKKAMIFPGQSLAVTGRSESSRSSSSSRAHHPSSNSSKHTAKAKKKSAASKGGARKG